MDVLLVTSRQWYEVVERYALPPGPRAAVLFEEGIGSTSRIELLGLAGRVAEWILART